MPIPDPPPAELVYTNHRGDTRKRKIVPIGVRYGSTKWHVLDQWLLDAYDIEKGEYRTFALKDFGEPRVSLAREEWREICKYLQSVGQPVAERHEDLDGSVTMSMKNVIERIVEDWLRLRKKEDINHDMLRPHYYQCEVCGGMGRNMRSDDPRSIGITTCTQCRGSGFVGKKE